MGKQSASKAKSSGRTSNSMSDYFLQSPTTAPTGPATGPPDKMAPQPEMEVGGVTNNNAVLTREDLMVLKEDLKQHVTSQLDLKFDSLTNRLLELTNTVKDVSNTASEAYDLSKAQECQIKALQASEGLLRDRVAWLEGKVRALNLKLRGLPELPELNSNLAPAIASWLASLLHLEDGVAPTIIAAYRVGPSSAIKPGFPRDVVVQFLYAKSRDAVLQLTRNMTALQFKGAKVMVLLDLSPEILLKRKTLKPITDHLKSHNVRFRWSASSDIMVICDGSQYKANDVASGRTLLAALDLPLPPS